MESCQRKEVLDEVGLMMIMGKMSKTGEGRYEGGVRIRGMGWFGGKGCWQGQYCPSSAVLCYDLIRCSSGEFLGSGLFKRLGEDIFERNQGFVKSSARRVEREDMRDGKRGGKVIGLSGR